MYVLVCKTKNLKHHYVRNLLRGKVELVIVSYCIIIYDLALFSQ